MPANVTIDINSLFLFLGACQAFIFIILLTFKRQKKRVINLHLSILLFAIGGEVCHYFLIETQYITRLPILVGFILPLDALVGISLYWYVRIITHPEKGYTFAAMLKHYWIFFACLILSIPYWLLPFNEKLSLMQTGVVPADWPALAYYATLAQIPIKIISFTTYLFISIYLLLRHRQRIKDVFSYRERLTLNWLTFLLLLFVAGLIQGVGGLIFFQEYTDAIQVMGFMGVFSFCAIFYIGTMGLMQPLIYLRTEESYLKQALINTTEQDDIATKNVAKENIALKYQNSALAPEDMQRIAKKLDDILRARKLFLNPNLTMPSLAEDIGVSANYLSQTINSVYQTNFYDFINGKRIEYAKTLLVDKEKQHLSIIDIAVESAFNSRSSFYNAFKDRVGMTPVQFRKSHLA